MAGLEVLIERHDLILNNEPTGAIRLTCRNTTSIINLTFITLEIGALDTWVVDEEFSTSSDHEVIVYDFATLDKTVRRITTSQEITG